MIVLSFFPQREVRTLIIKYREKVFFEGFLSARDEQTKIKLLAFLLLLVLFSWFFLWFREMALDGMVDWCSDSKGWWISHPQLFDWCISGADKFGRQHARDQRSISLNTRDRRLSGDPESCEVVVQGFQDWQLCKKNMLISADCVPSGLRILSLAVPRETSERKLTNLKRIFKFFFVHVLLCV